jgi:hypothetical protein
MVQKNDMIVSFYLSIVLRRFGTMIERKLAVY